MQTRLKAIDPPQSLFMRLTYWFSRKKFGKVLTPLKVASSRLPFAFSLWGNKIHPLERKLNLPEELTLLVRLHVVQLNTCSFCIDIKKAISMQKFRNQEKFFQLSGYLESDWYGEAEKAALDFSHALTVHKKVPGEVFERARLHFSENQQVGLAWVVSTEHLCNLMNVAFHIKSNGLCQLPEPAAFAAKEDSGLAHWLQDAPPAV